MFPPVPLHHVNQQKVNLLLPAYLCQIILLLAVQQNLSLPPPLMSQDLTAFEQHTYHLSLFHQHPQIAAADHHVILLLQVLTLKHPVCHWKDQAGHQLNSSFDINQEYHRSTYPAERLLLLPAEIPAR